MIIVNFEDENYKRVTGLWQWDYGQVLRIQGLNLPKAVEIHFSLQESGGEAKKRVGFTKDGVTDVVIPESMLENEESLGSYDIFAFIYLTDDTSGQTEYKICMPVKARPKPEAFDKPEDEEIFREAIKAVNDAAERAEESERQAGEYAEQTKADVIKTGEDRTAIAEMVDSVSGIEQQVETVKEYKDQAQTAATNALLSEQKSNEAKEAALQAQAEAETAADEAEKRALEVAGDKAEVERLATQVRQDKSSVEQTVQEFGSTVQQAEQSINTAKTKAVEAVNASKSDAIKAVQTEGTKQTEAVQAKGQEVINSIPSDYTTQMATKLDKQQGTENAGKALIVDKDGNVIVGEPAIQIEVDKTLTQEGQAADAKATGDKILQYAIKNTASGEGILRITDSAEEKLLDFAMQGKTEQASTTGKNLFDITKLKSNMISAENIDIEESTITLPAGGAIYFNKLKDVCTDLKVGDEVYLFAKSTGTKAFAGFYHETASTPSWNFNTKQIVTDEMLNGALLLYSDSDKSVVLSGIMITKLNDKTYEPYTGGKPSPSVEYPQKIVSAGDDGQIDVKVTGKNLFDISKNKYKCDEEKICIPSKALAEINITEGIIFEEKTAYFLSWESYIITKPNSDWSPIFGVEYTDKAREEYYMHFYKNGTKTNANKTIKYVYIRNPWSVGTEINRIQIEKGTGRTEYEPFKLQTITFHLDRPLTKWDRIEKQDGVWGVVYKSKEVVFNGSEDEVWRNQTDSSGNTQFYTDLKDCPIKHVSDFVDNFYCDKFTKSSKAGGDIAIGEVRYGSLGAAFAPVFKPKHEVGTLLLWRDLLKENPITILYVTDSEEFVPFDEETQTALNNLRTYYPTTVITNSEDCEMEVEYVADTKNYIDNKISANVASVISQYQTNVANLLSLMPLSVQAGMVENDTNNILENVEVMKHE